MSKKYFSKQYLLEELKKAGLPHTHPSLIKMEKQGIIPPANSAVGFGTMNHWRLYTKEEIQEIVAKVKTHKHALAK